MEFTLALEFTFSSQQKFMKKGYFCKFTRLYSEDQEKGGFMVREWTKDYFHEK